MTDMWRTNRTAHAPDDGGTGHAEASISGDISGLPGPAPQYIDLTNTDVNSLEQFDSESLHLTEFEIADDRSLDVFPLEPDGAAPSSLWADAELAAVDLIKPAEELSTMHHTVSTLPITLRDQAASSRRRVSISMVVAAAAACAVAVAVAVTAWHQRTAGSGVESAPLADRSVAVGTPLQSDVDRNRDAITPRPPASGEPAMVPAPDGVPQPERTVTSQDGLPTQAVVRPAADVGMNDAIPSPVSPPVEAATQSLAAAEPVSAMTPVLPLQASAPDAVLEPSPGVVVTSPVAGVPLPPPARIPSPAADLAAATAAPSGPGSVVAVTDTQAIERVLDRYRTAFNRLDLDGTKTVWPGVDVRSLKRAFDRLDQQEVIFDGCHIEVTGTRAVALCAGSARYVPKVGNRNRPADQRQWAFDLQRAGSGWLIAGVSAR